MNIYLVGFMATGKTTVAKELARKISWDFLDLDELIQKEQLRKISEIFALKGEAYFRKLENKALNRVSRLSKAVISCGGGIVVNPDNIRLMKKTGLIVCLSAKPAVILKRTAGFKDRPLLNVSDPAGKIKELLKKRAAFYAQADCHIDTSRLTINGVVKKIIKIIS